MWLNGLYLRNFRSTARTSVRGFGGMNVLIGRNNAGKSTLLSAIQVLHAHLRAGVAARSWPSRRPADDFTDRDVTARLQIGADLVLSPEQNSQLRQELIEDSPQLTKAVHALEGVGSVAVVLGSDTAAGSKPVLFVEQLAVGTVVDEGDALQASGTSLLGMGGAAARELSSLETKLKNLEADRAVLAALVDMEVPEEFIKRGDATFLRYMLSSREGFAETGAIPRVTGRLTPHIKRGISGDDFKATVRQMVAQLDADAAQVAEQEISTEMRSFAGTTKTVPAYVGWLMARLGEVRLLSLGERREAIGRAEAQELLRLKTKRGGEKKLRAVQDTVQSLLGVDIDAFEPDNAVEGRQEAELDVDRVLVSMNGAGVREALRLIMDLELKGADVVLIEEPEVHLHPGLERVLESYLREKSMAAQLFLTTHSSNFVDAIAFQNVYLVGRAADSRTSVRVVGEGDGPWQIPAEIGLRLSSVFMYERLVFVEGPSDEGVLREFARALGIDLARVGVGFVRMGGVRNFAHFAANATLDLLHRRRMPMTFIVDRDERNDIEVSAMVARLGDRAVLATLGRRELENYLLEPRALAKYIELYRVPAAKGHVDPGAIVAALEAAADGVKQEVIRLRLVDRVLRPIFPVRLPGTDPHEKLAAARREIEQRADDIRSVEAEIRRDVDACWSECKLALAPGSLLLAAVARQFGAAFDKAKGDSLRLAQLQEDGAIDPELAGILRAVVQ